MLESYVEYLNRFLRPSGLGDKPEPGEHHFVAVYLLPKLYALNGVIPDYVNPDGTKEVLGDVVYYQDGRHFFGIEAKVGTIRLTANEFNTWILDTDDTKHPHLFVGLGTQGLVLQTWARFRASYVELIGSPDLDALPRVKKGAYGPQRTINVLIKSLQNAANVAPGELFLWTQDRAEAAARETAFASALRSAIGA